MQKSDPLPRLRQATNADSGAIRELIFSILNEYSLKPDPDGTDADLVDIESHYRVGWFAVLEINHTIIGSVAVCQEKDQTFELRKMYLHANWRRQGYGRMLLDQAINKARVLGANRLVLGTASVLVEAVGLYQSRGFVPSVETPTADRCDQVWELDLRQPPALTFNS